MQGNKAIISQLNCVLGNELVAINQYFLHARMFKNFGFSKLDKADYHRSIDNMKNADKLVERILFLEGLPNLQKLGRLFIGEDSAEILQSNLKMENSSLDLLKKAVKDCEDDQDYVSRALLEEILGKQELQIDWLETQQSLVVEMGLQNYLQSQC